MLGEGLVAVGDLVLWVLLRVALGCPMAGCERLQDSVADIDLAAWAAPDVMSAHLVLMVEALWSVSCVMFLVICFQGR